MEPNEHNLIAIERKLTKGLVLLFVILALLVLGYFSGRALYDLTH